MRLLFFVARRAMAEGGSIASGHRHQQPELTDEQWTTYICIVVALVLLAGLMSGLTLGLMSMDVLDMEVGISQKPLSNFLQLLMPSLARTRSGQSLLALCRS